MHFLPISLTLFLLFLLLIPLLFILAPAVAFAKMGLHPFFGYAFFLICLIGGGINIPVYRDTSFRAPPVDDFTLLFHRFLGIRIPVAREQVIAVNFGGAILPSLLSIYLLGRVPLTIAIGATAVTSAASYLLSRPIKGVGIVMPPFVPPIIAAITAMALARDYAPQIAYISGVMGTLIGADLLRVHQIKKLGSPFMSIGGAGIFDGIYLVGLVSVLLA
ncbi:MAG: DUF1614 domain-containing protein [Nitrospiraceae bacterium]|nr:MAG: DUF1614 domain-containing protein [Nitrospiraceae bacterium]